MNNKGEYFSRNSCKFQKEFNPFAHLFSKYEKIKSVFRGYDLSGWDAFIEQVNITVKVNKSGK